MAEEPDTIDPLFKLRNSPLQGVEAYRSPFYRRLLSAGYKGYVQGSMGGATLIGLMGAALGGVFGSGLWFAGAATALGPTLLITVPAFAFFGMHYGKDAFGNIGALAAISAEQAELSEKRRNLLDRYFETPSKEEAKEIERQLREQPQEKKPEHWYHWRTGLLGAVIIGGLVLSAALFFPAALSGTLGHLGLESIVGGLSAGTGAATAAAGASFSIAATALLTGIGVLAGAFIGIDRAYIRKWFDAQETLHDDRDSKRRRGEHNQEVERLQQAYRREGFGFESRGVPGDGLAKATPISPRTIAQPNPQPGNLSTESKAMAEPGRIIDAGSAELQQRAQPVNLSAPVAAL